MDDLKVFNDENLSVRNTANRIIQFSYGEDGIDPSRGVHGKPFNIDVIVDAALGTDGPTKTAEQAYKDSGDKVFDLGHDDGVSEDVGGES
jgi:hypothetical protein